MEFILWDSEVGRLLVARINDCFCVGMEYTR